jgi:hypothetical protein
MGWFVECPLITTNEWGKNLPCFFGKSDFFWVLRGIVWATFTVLAACR